MAKDATQRLFDIYKIIDKSDGITKENLINSLGLEYNSASKRKIERDLIKLYENFNIRIICSTYHRYYIDKENSSKDEKRIRRIMGLYSSAIFQLKYANEAEFIFPETASNENGDEHLEDLYYAIKKGFSVNITHKSFWSDESKEMKISPIQLNEYNKRWYVVSFTEDNKKRVYGLDRILSLRVLIDEEVHRQKPLGDFFKNIVGISQPELPKETVVLLFNSRQGLYVKSLPIHHSQNVISDDEDGLRIEINVGVNWELKEEIKKHGSLVRVIEPAHLVNEIKNDLSTSLEQYK